MAITTTWKIDNMERQVADGGVVRVHWACTAQADSGEVGVYSDAFEFTPDSSEGTFIAYDDLTEETVLGWVYDKLRLISEDNEEFQTETADEAKARIETKITNNLQAKIDRKAAIAKGKPWS